MMTEKGIIFNIFKYFKKHEKMQEIISCVMIFFILINLINIRKIEVEAGLVKESVEVTMKAVVGQVSNISRIYIESFLRVFVMAEEGVELKEQKARRDVEKIIAKEIKLMGARFIEGEGARGGDKGGEQTGGGNSLMASVGYLMLTDIHEKGRGIKEVKGEGDRFSVWGGIIRRDIEIEERRYFKGGSISLGSGDIRKEKEGKLLLAKELSMIDMRGNNILTGKEEVVENKINKRLSL